VKIHGERLGFIYKANVLTLRYNCLNLSIGFLDIAQILPNGWFRAAGNGSDLARCGG
jgi:hypothetical protein